MIAVVYQHFLQWVFVHSLSPLVGLGGNLPFEHDSAVFWNDVIVKVQNYVLWRESPDEWMERRRHLAFHEVTYTSNTRTQDNITIVLVVDWSYLNMSLPRNFHKIYRKN